MRQELEDTNVDQAGKGPDWHTAFYYLAEHLRILSAGNINHKDLYALVGVDDRYVNHQNPLVRKRTAGALSRIVHSRQYAKDMQVRYTQSSLVFNQAADAVCACIIEAQLRDPAQIFEYLVTRCWRDVRLGLDNERSSWRPQLNLFRIDREMSVLIETLRETKLRTSNEAAEASKGFLAALLHVIAFGYLEFQYARSLVDNQPTGAIAALKKCERPLSEACLVKFADASRSAMLGTWLLNPSRPFTIGRYTDCDIVEVNPGLSRVHGCVYRKGGCWYFEDLGSRNGSSVTRANGETVFNAKADGPLKPVELQRGDEIVLGGISQYWFGAASESASYSMVRF